MNISTSKTRFSKLEQDKSHILKCSSLFSHLDYMLRTNFETADPFQSSSKPLQHEFAVSNCLGYLSRLEGIHMYAQLLLVRTVVVCRSFTYKDRDKVTACVTSKHALST